MASMVTAVLLASLVLLADGALKVVADDAAAAEAITKFRIAAMDVSFDEFTKFIPRCFYFGRPKSVCCQMRFCGITEIGFVVYGVPYPYIILFCVVQND